MRDDWIIICDNVIVISVLAALFIVPKALFIVHNFYINHKSEMFKQNHMTCLAPKLTDVGN